MEGGYLIEKGVYVSEDELYRPGFIWELGHGEGIEVVLRSEDRIDFGGGDRFNGSISEVFYRCELGEEATHFLKSG